MAYVASVRISVDCGSETKVFEPGESLDGVLPGCLESMIRMGQAIESGGAKAPKESATPKKKE